MAEHRQISHESRDCLDVPWVDRQRPLEQRVGVEPAALAIPEPGQHGKRCDVVGGNVQQILEVLRRACEVAATVIKDNAGLTSHRDIVGRQLKGALDRLFRQRESSCAPIQKLKTRPGMFRAETRPRQREFRIQFDRTLQQRDPFLEKISL